MHSHFTKFHVLNEVVNIYFFNLTHREIDRVRERERETEFCFFDVFFLFEIGIGIVALCNFINAVHSDLQCNLLVWCGMHMSSMAPRMIMILQHIEQFCCIAIASTAIDKQFVAF